MEGRMERKNRSLVARKIWNGKPCKKGPKALL